MPTSPWQGRLELIARQITVPCSVLDVGAGNEALADLLPGGCLYTPIDVRNGKQFDVDLNDGIPGGYDVAVAAGLFEHMNNPGKIFIKIAATTDRILFSYVPIENEKNRIGWKSHLTEKQVFMLADGIGKFGQWLDHNLYEWRRKP